MKAVIYEGHGDSSILELVERPIPEPVGGDVDRVRDLAGAEILDVPLERTPGSVSVAEQAGDALDDHAVVRQWRRRRTAARAGGREEQRHVADLEPVVHQVAALDLVARERIQVVEPGGVVDVRRAVRRVGRTEHDGLDVGPGERTVGGVVRRGVADAGRRRQQRQAEEHDGPASHGAAPHAHASDATIGRCEI